jgi:monoamine oxidase
MSDTSASTDEIVYDAIIIGGGVAGLTAAFWLGPQLKRVLVIEGEASVGGRIETAKDDPDIDLGAAYFGPLQAYTMRVCEMLGILHHNNDLTRDIDHRIEFSDPKAPVFTYRNDSFSVPDRARDQRMEGRRRTRLAAKQLQGELGVLGGYVARPRVEEPDPSVPAPPTPVEYLQLKIAEIETLVFRMREHLQAPWNCPASNALQTQSVAQWIDDNIGKDYPTVKDLLEVGVRSALSAEPYEVSMLYLIYYAATGGSFVNVMAVGKGADSFRFKNGARQLPASLSSWIEKKFGGTIEVGTKVTAISHDEDDKTVTVTTSNGIRRARQCIVAMSPSDRGKIDVVGLPEADKIGDVMTRARTIKAFVRFRNPWWRAIESSGYVLSARRPGSADPDGGPVVWTMDNTWHGRLTDAEWKEVGEEQTRYSLMAFITGEHADLMQSLSKADLFAKIIDHWARIFDVDAGIIRRQLVVDPASDPDTHLSQHYLEFRWVKTCRSGGCPAAFFGPGQFTRKNMENLRNAFKSVHWAGSETATDWVGGYLNGAIQSGVRAAEEVLSALLLQDSR